MSDHDSYIKFMGKAELDKAVNSLIGLLEGISIDHKINDAEIEFLETWLSDHRISSNRHPFNELFPVVEQAISDGILTSDEKEDIVWLCDRLTSNEYFNTATSDMQKLHAIMAGIGADGVITVEELKGLMAWLDDHERLKTCWPYDEVQSMVLGVLADKKIDSEEHAMLMKFFGEFISILDNQTIVNPAVAEDTNIVGLCAVCPEIKFPDAVFCLTGSSHKYKRNDFEELITSLGGNAANTVSKKVHHLVVGSDGNPCWAYACYGRKVEKAIELRKQGHKILIVHENDFHDAVLDL